MQKPKRTTLLGTLVVLLLTGCSLFAGAQITPPPSNAVLQPTPILEGGIAEEATPDLPAGAGQGDVLFVRDGQLWAVGGDGSGERPLTALPKGSILRSLALSPGGQYVAFTIASQQVMVLDLGQGGQPVMIAETPSGNNGSLVWSAEGNRLFYYEAIVDDQGLVTANRIWQADMPPGTPPELLREADMATDSSVYYPGFVLGPDTLVVHRAVANSDDPGSWLLLTPSSGEIVALADGYGLWDVSPDRTKVLLFDQSEAMSTNVSLYTGTIPQPPAAVIGIAKISPEDAQGVFRSAHFVPDGVRVVSLQVTQTGQGGIGQAVLLQPDTDGIYQIIALAPQQEANDMALAWHGEDGVIVQRWLSGESGPSLWLLPLDGSPGQMLAFGEMPLVVGP